jgi:hypothetical protein
VAVFDSCGGAELACGLQHDAVCHLFLGGHTYYIAVSGSSPTPCPSAFSLYLLPCPDPPANDLCANAEDIELGNTSGVLANLTGTENSTCHMINAPDLCIAIRRLRMAQSISVFSPISWVARFRFIQPAVAPRNSAFPWEATIQARFSAYP